LGTIVSSLFPYPSICNSDLSTPNTDEDTNEDIDEDTDEDEDHNTTLTMSER